MKKILMVLVTHFIDEAVISEYRKVKIRRMLTQFWQLTTTNANLIQI